MSYVNRLLKTLEATEALDKVHADALRALTRVGKDAIDALLDAHASASADREDELRRDLGYVLANQGKRDPRILKLLVREMETDPDFGCAPLAEYGDEAALPYLHRAFRQLKLSETDLVHNHALVELEAAIEHLGGELDTMQRIKVLRARRLLCANNGGP